LQNRPVGRVESRPVRDYSWIAKTVCHTRALCCAAMRSRSSALGVFLALGLAGCQGKTAEGSQTEVGVETPKQPENSREQAQQDMFDELRLGERSFPLLIWSAHVVCEDYFDKSRFDPKGQLAAALE